MSTGLFGRLFGRGDRTRGPEPLLSEEQATRIANEAVSSLRSPAKLVLRSVWVEAGRLAWHFWTPTRGSGLTVAVDDASGEADVKQWGVR